MTVIQGEGTDALRSGDRHSMVRFLHLVPDDKFIDDARAIFEEVMPGGHDYVLLSSGGELRHIRTFEPSRIDVARTSVARLLEKLPSYQGVFVHFLTDAARQIVDMAPPQSRLIWIGWGGDYYHLIKDREQLLLPETRDLMARLAHYDSHWLTARKAIPDVARSLFRPIQSARRLRSIWRMRRIGPGRCGESHLLNRFDLFAPVLGEEYDTIVDANPGFRPQFAAWNYWTAGLGTLGGSIGTPSAHHLLLGNSATPENNHLEAMRLIAAVVGDDRKIICPLSYGDTRYGDSVSDTGAQLFGDRFVPLRGYMGTAAYVDILRSCSVVAMNHVRQQAMGNIIMMLWMGAWVFLNRDSPINGAMASIGIDIHDIRSLPEFLQKPDPGVDLNRIGDVRERLDHRFGRNAIIEKTKDLLFQASLLPGSR